MELFPISIISEFKNLINRFLCHITLRPFNF